jgi:hypothetical protein
VAPTTSTGGNTVASGVYASTIFGKSNAEKPDRTKFRIPLPEDFLFLAPVHFTILRSLRGLVRLRDFKDCFGRSLAPAR